MESCSYLCMEAPTCVKDVQLFVGFTILDKQLISKKILISEKDDITNDKRIH